MKYLIYLLLLSILILPACGSDDDQHTMMNYETYDTDEDIDAPIVDCEEAFNLFQYTDNTGSPTDRRINGLDFNSEGIGIGIDEDNNLWRVTGDGRTWERINFPLGDAAFVFQPSFAGDETVYLTRSGRNGAGSNLLRSDDRGETFRLLTNATWRTVFDKHFNSAEEGYLLINDPVVADELNTQLLATTDGGASWSELSMPSDLGSTPRFLTVGNQLAIDTDRGLLVQIAADRWEERPYPDRTINVSFSGDHGIIITDVIDESGFKVYRTSDGGISWATDDLPYQRPRYLESFDDNSALMIANRYRVIGGDALSFRGLLVYESTDGGATWDVLKTNNDCSFGRFLFTVPSGKRISVGRDKIVVIER